MLREPGARRRSRREDHWKTGYHRVVVPLELVGVRLEVPGNSPVIMLREQDGRHRVLPIYIGSPEAAAIHYAVEGIVPMRPLTHDLMCTLLAELDTVLERVLITEVVDGTFYAELHLRESGTAKIVSCRPSDGVALAVRTDSPIFASEDVLDEAGHEEAVEDPDEADDADEILAEFQNFIDQVSPDDFESR